MSHAGCVFTQCVGSLRAACVSSSSSTHPLLTLNLTLHYARAQAGFQQGAFYRLADALRLHSPVLDDALRAYAWHVRDKGPAADWRAFMIATFGMDACDKLMAAHGGA